MIYHIIAALILVSIIIYIYFTRPGKAAGTQQPAQQTPDPWVTNEVKQNEPTHDKSSSYTTAGGEYYVYNDSDFTQGYISTTGMDLHSCVSTCDRNPTCFAVAHNGERCFDYAPSIYPQGTSVTASMLKPVPGRNLYVKSPTFKNEVPENGKCIVGDPICNNDYYNNLCPSLITDYSCNGYGCCKWVKT